MKRTSAFSIAALVAASAMAFHAPGAFAQTAETQRGVPGVDVDVGKNASDKGLPGVEMNIGKDGDQKNMDTASTTTQKSDRKVASAKHHTAKKDRN